MTQRKNLGPMNSELGRMRKRPQARNLTGKRSKQSLESFGFKFTTESVTSTHHLSLFPLRSMLRSAADSASRCGHSEMQVRHLALNRVDL
jgi:hypothetical protein